MLNLKAKVEEVLKEDEMSRNSDIRLTNYIWNKYYSNRLFRNDKDKLSVQLIDLYDLPSQGEVKRVRAWFNSKGKYLPTDIKVVKARRLNEDTWRRELGLSNKRNILLSY